MKRVLLTLLAFVVACGVGSAAEFETFQLWPDVAPGEKADAVKPTYELWKPAEKRYAVGFHSVPDEMNQLITEKDSTTTFTNNRQKANL